VVKAMEQQVHPSKLVHQYATDGTDLTYQYDQADADGGAEDGDR
jgi:hypothetical protein